MLQVRWSWKMRGVLAATVPLAMMTTGCLYLGPVDPVPNLISSPPSFTYVYPTSPNVVLSNNASQFTFTVHAYDPNTPRNQLEYQWLLDNGQVLTGTGISGESYNTTGASLGTNPPNPVLQVAVTGALSLPTTHQWSITVQ